MQKFLLIACTFMLAMVVVSASASPPTERYNVFKIDKIEIVDAIVALPVCSYVAIADATVYVHCVKLMFNQEQGSDVAVIVAPGEASRTRVNDLKPPLIKDALFRYDSKSNSDKDRWRYRREVKYQTVSINVERTIPYYARDRSLGTV